MMNMDNYGFLANRYADGRLFNACGKVVKFENARLYEQQGEQWELSTITEQELFNASDLSLTREELTKENTTILERIGMAIKAHS